MSFGMFMAPFHPPRSNPTLDFARDLELVEWLDDLGFDEVCFGEHHSGGYETIGCPELMISAAAPRTKRVRLGTGVISVPYHNPFLVAERMVMLDHLTRGRVFFGLGPGALPSDTNMLGIDYSRTRERLAQGTEAIMHLLTSDEPLTMDAGWFTLKDARLNLKPFQRPHPPMAIAATLSPSGPTVAGKYGLPLMSLSATSPSGRQTLREHWQIATDRAEQFGVPMAPRSQWRLIGPMHIAETREQAMRDVEYGINQFGEYFFREDAILRSVRSGVQERSDMTIPELFQESGTGVIGTPDDAIAFIEELQQKSGGFGSFMVLHHEWANREATRRSYELLAHHVLPHFQDAGRAVERWHDMRANQKTHAAMVSNAITKAQDQHEAGARAQSDARAAS